YVQTLFIGPATALPLIYTLSLHDALPISSACCRGTSGSFARSTADSCAKCRSTGPGTTPGSRGWPSSGTATTRRSGWRILPWWRSEEHTSELQSRENLVCRLLLEKKKKDR